MSRWLAALQAGIQGHRGLRQARGLELLAGALQGDHEPLPANAS